MRSISHPGVHALFDPNYLPRRLLHRDEELQTLSTLLPKEEPTACPVNIMVHGSLGVGRTTLLRFYGHNELAGCRVPLVNFSGKSPGEIIRDSLSTLTGRLIRTSKLPILWDLLKRLLRKAETPIIFIFDDVDRRTHGTYTKYLHLCKECRIPSMTTAPLYFPRQLSPETAQLLDYSLELGPYTDHQLLDIAVQRVSAAFPKPLPREIIEFIADIVCTLDFQRPATVVELLRALYPVVANGVSLNAEHIRRACMTSTTLHYDFWSGHLAGLASLEATSILLLQAVGEYFLTNSGSIYASKQRLFHQFHQVCERIGIQSTTTQFTRALNELLFRDLLLQSRYNTQNYYTLLPPTGYLEIVELILGEAEDGLRAGEWSHQPPPPP